MNKEIYWNDRRMDIEDRIEDLRNVTAWSFENGGLNAGERICISQERAALLREIDSMEPGYKIPAKLEEKVQHILQVIKNTGWQKEIIKY